MKRGRFEKLPRLIAALFFLAVPGSARAEPPSIAALPVDHEIALDGYDDPAWARAPAWTRFYQREPDENKPATQATDLRVAFSGKTLFLRIRMNQALAPLIARERRRDADLSGDDQIELLLDTFHDRRTAYYFATNANGVEVDGHFSEEGTSTTISLDWDGLWDVRARRTGEGWEVLLSIPLAAISFDSGHGADWGINLKRTIRATNELDYISGWRREFAGKTASQAGVLTGLEGLGSRRLIQASPYALGAAEHLSNFPDNNLLGKAGVDFRYGLSSKIEADLTVNTDFAETDADTQQINLTRFPLFFPEKRAFFLQRAQVFAFGGPDSTLPFFSRRIGLSPDGSAFIPIDAGLKLTGRLGKEDVGFFGIRTRAGAGEPPTTFGLVRWKHDFGKGSYLGALGIDAERDSPADSSRKYNRTYGFDGRFAATPRLSFNGFFVATKDPRGFSGDNRAKFLSANYQDDSWNLYGSFFDVGLHYDTQVGFTPRTGIRNYFGDITFHPPHPLPSIRSIDFEYFQNYDKNRDGSLQEREYQATIRVYWENGAYLDSDLFDTFREHLTEPFEIHRGVVLEPGLYTITRHQLAFGSDNSRDVYASGNFTFGPFYDGYRRYFRAEIDYKPTSSFAVAVNEQYNVIRLREGDFDLSLLGIRLNWNPSVRLLASAFVQANTDARLNAINVRVRWLIEPGTDLFVVYDQRTGRGLERADRKLTVKFVKAFDL
jgi:hypothetical protein